MLVEKILTHLLLLLFIHFLKKFFVVLFGMVMSRVRVEKNGGAWCPRGQATQQARDYLEVELRSEHVITAVETQGRFGNGQGQEYAEHFLLEYWRDSLAKWVRYKHHNGNEVTFDDHYSTQHV